jgi:hypothetical protein
MRIGRDMFERVRRTMQCVKLDVKKTLRLNATEITPSRLGSLDAELWLHLIRIYSDIVSSIEMTRR